MVNLVWLESKQNDVAAQLVSIASAIKTQGAQYGLTPVQIATMNSGAQMNNYLQTTLMAAAHDYASAITRARDELQSDKTPQRFELPVFDPPAPPVSAPDSEPLQTDVIAYFNDCYGIMQRAGLTPANAQAMGWVVTTDVSAPNPATMKPRVTSILTEAAGKTTVSVERQNQKQIHFRITLDTGEVFNKTLPNSKATFALPVDRVHHFDAMAIYADKNGDDYGQWSDTKSDTSEL